jgi:hypothetical protein
MKKRTPSSGQPGSIEAPIDQRIEALKVKIQRIIDADEARRRTRDTAISNSRSTGETTEPITTPENQYCTDISEVQVVQQPDPSEATTKTAPGKVP